MMTKLSVLMIFWIDSPKLIYIRHSPVSDIVFWSKFHVFSPVLSFSCVETTTTFRRRLESGLPGHGLAQEPILPKAVRRAALQVGTE